MFAVTESWGRPALLDSFITFDGYCLFRRDRLDRSGGDVILLVREDLQPSSFVFPAQSRGTFEDSVWCAMTLASSKRLLLGCLYRSPQSSSVNDQCLNDLFTMACHAPFNYQVIVRDFNCPDIHVSLYDLSSSPSCQFLVDFVGLMIFLTHFRYLLVRVTAYH